MKTLIVSVIGLDYSGIVYTISHNLALLGGTIQEASQTILKNQFAGIFVVSCPDTLAKEALHEALQKAMDEKKLQLFVSISDFVEGEVALEEAEPFVITAQGHDRHDLVASIAEIFADHYVNIENFKARCLDTEGATALLVFEVALPKHTNFPVLRKTLMEKAEELDLILNMQHRDIFEAIHRVSPI